MKSLPRDKVVIIQALGQTVKGKVLTADNWGTVDEPCWYIEFIDTYGNYRYWKQDQDKGDLLEPQIN